jgi:hypothetical protein
MRWLHGLSWHPCTKSVLNDNMGLFGLKISWDLAWAFLVFAALTVLLSDEIALLQHS